MHALARGAARASGFCHHLSTFDAVWEIVYRVLRSPEGARLRAISTLGYQSHRTAKAVARIAVQSSHEGTWAKFDALVLRNAPRSCNVGAVNERVIAKSRFQPPQFWNRGLAI